MHQQPDRGCVFAWQHDLRPFELDADRAMAKMRRELLADDCAELRAAPITAHDHLMSLGNRLQPFANDLLQFGIRVARPERLADYRLNDGERVSDAM